MPDVAPEVKIEQLRNVIKGMGWTINKIEILEGDVIRLAVIHQPNAPGIVPGVRPFSRPGSPEEG